MNTQSTSNKDAKWNTPIGMLHSRLPTELEDYVLIGKTRDGSPVIFSSGDESTSKNLLSKFGGFQSQDQGSRQEA